MRQIFFQCVFCKRTIIRSSILSPQKTQCPNRCAGLGHVWVRMKKV